MNNKGFAISTVIYGLSIIGVLVVSILMGIMSTTRATNRTFSKTVEDELNRFSRTEINLSPKDAQTQTYTVPPGESGWYRIELWGAQGGQNGGLGAYTSGIIKLTEEDELYIYVGKHDGSTSSSGQETDIRIYPGGYNEQRSYQTRIMVAAGGGSDAGASGGTLYGYTNKMTPTGGQIQTIDTQVSKGDYMLVSGSNLIGSPTGANYVKSQVYQTTSTVPKPHQTGSRGGDGYFSSSLSSTGGVSFIAGYAGSKLYNYSSNTFYSNSVYTYNSKSYFFYDGKMIPGVNQGDGKARIKRIAKITEEDQYLHRKNKKMDNVSKIRDCISTTKNASTNIIWGDLLAMKDGVNVAGTKTAETKSGFRCQSVSISPAKNLDEIAVWHKDNVDYQDHTIEVLQNGAWKYIKNVATSDSETRLAETETVNGIRISAYQPDYTIDLPDSGNYYIIPVLTENKAISARKLANDDSNKLEIENLTGDKRQIWSIELIDENLRKASQKEYKIMELARFKALSIYLDENKLGNGVVAAEHFNSYARNDVSIWKLVPVGNGTYRIETVVEVFDTGNPTGNLCPNTSTLDPDRNKIVIAPNKVPNNTQRFKLIALD